MNVTDIAGIVFVCVAANHLGLIAAIEKETGYQLTVVRCPKCFTFWATLAYGCENIATYTDIITVLAISFGCAWLALWVELGMGVIDTIYNKVYDKITEPAADYETATDPSEGDADGQVSELQ